MDIIVRTISNRRVVTYRTVGGVLDFYIFAGPSPADVVRQYTDVIGKPYLPPLWSLGFHQVPPPSDQTDSFFSAVTGTPT